MTCNWLVGRGKAADIGEEEDLYVPPSSALAGKIYKTLMSQVTAGKKHGGMNEVDGVRFPLKKSEIAMLEKIAARVWNPKPSCDPYALHLTGHLHCNTL
jgi:hypothetical protein